MRYREKAPVSRFVISPLNYAGGKSRLLHKILPQFGDLSQVTFIDVFAGGMNVGMNAGAHKVVFNDVNEDVVALGRLFTRPAAEVAAGVDALVASYGLSDSHQYGYPHYGTTSARGLAEWNKVPFNHLKTDINSGRFDETLDVAVFTMVLFAFNNYMQRSTVDGRWTPPVGKRDFNASMRSKLRRTSEQLQKLEVTFQSKDFSLIRPQDYSKPFFYFDPPYTLGTAPYNKTWSESDDERLFDFIDAIDADGQPWAMSNVFTLNGVDNERLQRWASRYRVVDLDFDYANSSHRKRDKRRAGTREVIVMPR